MFSVISSESKWSRRVSRIHDDVFEHRAEADRVPDLRLVLPREANALGVAAAFEVEDAVVAPAVLVVADQAALRVGGERRLAGARKAEEQRHVARRPHIRGAVHREDAARGQQVIHDRERRLLHLAGIAGAADQHDALFEIDDDAGLRVGAVLGGVRLEFRREQDRELGRHRGLRRIRPDEKLPRRRGCARRAG